MEVIDQAHRITALDPARSFIVQAPAGSGKTEILTQRVLQLLAHVDRAPEQVVAITFTRKAAAEMRARLLNALKKAQNEPEPPSSHQHRTWQLAQAVLQRDKQLNWQLIQNPSRLRILTIDSLCARITRAAPLLTHFGGQPEVLQDPYPVYLRAARALLESLNARPKWATSMYQIMLHLDNNQAWVEELLVAMLARRDQWLGHVMTDHQREHLEEGLANTVQEILLHCFEHLPTNLLNEIFACQQFSAHNLGQVPITNWPNPDPENLSTWQTLANFLLTTNGELRKSATKSTGFPPQTEAMDSEQKTLFKAMKSRMQEVYATLSEHPDFISALQEVLYAPPPCYTDQQWQLVRSLLEILPLLVAQLTLQFQRLGAVDFIEIASGALRALGSDDEPTEVALNLDYQIQHLLVDEFQDTSVTQYRLLELLTAGWQRGDGRTLFIVGDPMQSIYRFREAEVGLFLRARHFGLGNIPLEFLQLSMNFRSTTSIIEWINQTFVDVFPPEENIATGAVPFAQSTAADLNTECAVEIHALLDNGLVDEAARVVEVVFRERNRKPESSIAILVRSRSHLIDIIPALKREGLRFQAIEVEKLSHCVVIQDLLSLTRALLHPEDRVAWLSILRAPWCGLTLADLHCVANARGSILEACSSVTLNDDGQTRLDKILPALQRAVSERQRQPLHLWVKKTWEALNGPSCVQSPNELDNAQTFFLMLRDLDQGALLPELSELQRRLDALFAQPDPLADPRLQIMTIHKSKGLEFDCVIIPSLERRAAIDESRLLIWQERPRRREDACDLILAPIKFVGDDFDPIYRHVRRIQNQKSQFENMRLLYVAATRAKSRLHLLGTLANSETAPSSSSFLGLLWGTVQKSFTDVEYQTQADEKIAQQITTRTLKRLAIEDLANHKPYQPPQVIPNTFTLDLDEHAHFVGTVIHSVLQQIAKDGLSAWSEQRLYQEQDLWRAQLLSIGVPIADIQEALSTVSLAIINTLNDEHANWLFDLSHSDAHSEYPLSIFTDGTIKHLVLDRTFIDSEGIRWIIDYKTSEPRDGQTKDAFLREQQSTYREQLVEYAMAMSLLDAREIRCALYFPMLQELLVMPMDATV